MGLHPQAISILLLIVLELLTRGYKVCLSTHAQHVLDVVWALGLLRANQGTPDDVLDLFGAPHTRQLRDVAKGALRKSAKVYYFDRNGLTHDITSLDPGSPHPDESSWGGLTEFSGRVADVVADVIAASEKRGRR